MVKCPELQSKRDPGIIEPWKNLETKKQTAYILFKETNYERTANMIRNMYEHRKELLKLP